MEQIQPWITPAGIVLVLGFLWRFQRDVTRGIADLRERMARLEGTVDTLKDILTKREAVGS